MDLPHLLCTVEAGLQIPRDDEGSGHVVPEDVVKEEEGQPLGFRLVVHLRGDIIIIMMTVTWLGLVGWG